MSRWTHAICNECWSRVEPGREPVRLKVPMGEDCCFCGTHMTSGIYIRKDPTDPDLKGGVCILHEDV